MNKAGTILFISAVFLFIFTLYAPLFVSAQEQNISFILKDQKSLAPINNMGVVVDFYQNKSLIKSFIGKSDDWGVVVVPCEFGDYVVQIKADDNNTKYLDYIFNDLVSLKANSYEFYLVPIGYLKGIVVDRLDNVVAFAELNFDCMNLNSTTKYGSFSNPVSITGMCEVSAYYKGAVGFQRFEIKKGELTEVKIILDKTLDSYSDGKLAWYFFPLIILICAIVAFIIIGFRITISKKQHKSKQNQNAVLEKEENKKQEQEGIQEKIDDKRITDFMKTLNNKEQLVIEFILDNYAKQHYETSQAKIYYGTNIPKTTLSRIFQSLENKKFITCEKIGKMKKIKLTDFFLGTGK